MFQKFEENENLRKQGNAEAGRRRKTLVVRSLLSQGGLDQPRWHSPASLEIDILPLFSVELFLGSTAITRRNEYLADTMQNRF